jgi:uncharacterized cupin superfamily protein
MKPSEPRPVAIEAAAAPLRAKKSNYPEPFATRVSLREKRPLGDLFGLKNFGVNLTTLLPQGMSALRHAHSKQDEFVYILSGTAVLITDAGERQLSAGMCAGFPAGTQNGHQLLNRSDQPVTYLEVGDRTPGDSAFYPDDDLEAHLEGGAWQFRRKNGTPY